MSRMKRLQIAYNPKKLGYTIAYNPKKLGYTMKKIYRCKERKDCRLHIILKN
jgi:hypothetical protein